MFDVRLSQSLQSRHSNALSNSQKARLHVVWQGRNFRRNGFVEDFDPPRHNRDHISNLR